MRCKNCSKEFIITDADRAFYNKIDVPEPTRCPDCRQKRRLVFRNERNLYKRTCDDCKKNLVSIYKPDSNFPVFCYDCWWSDKWDARDYAQEVNLNEPIFPQLKSLFAKVPHLGIVIGSCENCDYANYTNYSKNSYLVFGCHAVEDSLYGWRMHDSFFCVDCLQIDKSSYCYNCVDCDECYELFFAQDCSHCNSGAFLYDCKGCQDCLFSAGLRNKNFCIFGKQYSPEEYQKEKAKLDLGSYSGMQNAKAKFQDYLKEYLRRPIFVIHSENVTGNHIINSEKVRFGFNLKNVQNGAYLESCEDLKDAMDSTFCGWPAELNYEGISAGCVNAFNNKFCATSWSCTNIDYCDSCHSSKELFGCFGLKNHNSHCILNKQYEPEKYSKLKDQIIKKMKAEGEYGEFFPATLSPFAYNESAANDFYPLNKELAEKNGFLWLEKDNKDFKEQTCIIPDHIKDASQSLVGEILVCSSCQVNFKMIAQEFLFYKKFNLALPRQCFNCRHQNRFSQRPARALWERICPKCSQNFLTTYAPDRPEKVYCENCYQKEVY